jgi:hypothetical protein
LPPRRIEEKRVKALRFLVRYPDGRGEELTIEAERVLIGSGAHCEIRLSVDQAAMEHVAISMGPASALAEARAFEPPPTINGSPFQRAQLLPDAILGVGQVQMTVAVIEIAEKQGLAPRKQEKTSPATYVLAAIAIPLSLYVILSDSDTQDGEPPPTEVPALWAEPITSCPQGGKEQARALANDQNVLALARRERRPFHVQDGVRAVPLFETAAACFEAAGDPTAAREAAEAGKKLRLEVDEDYRTHRVRLEHAISVSDWRTAQVEARVLLAFTDGLQGEYVTWLSNLDRKLQLKYGRKNR